MVRCIRAGSKPMKWSLRSNMWQSLMADLVVAHGQKLGGAARSTILSSRMAAGVMVRGAQMARALATAVLLPHRIVSM